MNPTASGAAIVNFRPVLTVDQTIAAALQLKKEEQAKLTKPLFQTELDWAMEQLIESLYSRPSVDEITDEEIIEPSHDFGKALNSDKRTSQF